MTRRQALRYQRFPVPRAIWQKPAIRLAAARPDSRTSRVDWRRLMSPRPTAASVWREVGFDVGNTITIPAPGLRVMLDDALLLERRAGTFRITAVTDTSITIASP